MRRMKIDFEQDLKTELYLAFNEYGVKIPIRKATREMLLDYLTILKKLIPIKVRKVFYAPEFEASLPNHPKKREIEYIRLLFETGKNVNFFQSKKLFQSQFHDHLLYEWNIYHFHLSLQHEKKSRFAKQTDLLLFIFIADDLVVFLGTEKHHRGIFGDDKWLQMLHDHFPEMIKEYEAKEIKDVSPQINSIERQTLWDKGYTLGFTKIKDRVYFCPGIGRTTSAHSTLVVKTAGEIIRWLHVIHEQFISEGNAICKYLNFAPEKAEFKLRLGNITLEIAENYSQKIVLTYNQVLDIEKISNKNSSP